MNMSYGKIDSYGFYNSAALDLLLGKNRFQKEMFAMGMHGLVASAMISIEIGIIHDLTLACAVVLMH